MKEQITSLLVLAVIPTVEPRVVDDLHYFSLGVVLIFVMVIADLILARKVHNMKVRDGKPHGRWTTSSFIRRSVGKLALYTCFLVMGSLIGYGVCEPWCWCNHTQAAGIGLLVGAVCETCSIFGHVLEVNGIEQPHGGVLGQFVRWAVNLGKSLNEKNVNNE